MSKFFIGIYTAECKKYCDEQFFRALGKLTEKDHDLWVVDNSLTSEYFDDRLDHGISNWYGSESYNAIHLDIPRDTVSVFHNNVAVSANWLRHKFLQTNAEYFVIFESDVIMPPNTLELFMEVIDKADIIDGIYHRWFTEPQYFLPESQEFREVPHALSGCCIFKRKVLEELEFRWDVNALQGFPDAWICADAREKGFKIGSYTKIKCEHLDDDDKLRGHTKIK